MLLDVDLCNVVRFCEIRFNYVQCGLIICSEFNYVPCGLIMCNVVFVFASSGVLCTG